MIDEKLNFEHHIDFLKSKISSLTGILYKLRNILPLNAKKIIYFSLIHSNISYASQVWGHSSSTRLQKLFSTQKKAIKAMAGLSYRASSLPIFQEHSIFPLHYLINFKSCIHIHGSLNQYLRTDQQYTQNNQIHHHNTRARENLHLYRHISVRNGVNSIVFKSKLLYNDTNIIPSNLKLLDKTKFKVNLKKCFELSLLNTPIN